VFSAVLYFLLEALELVSVCDLDCFFCTLACTSLFDKISHFIISLSILRRESRLVLKIISFGITEQTGEFFFFWRDWACSLRGTLLIASK